MFHQEDNASKAAIIFLAEYLSARGVAWIDCQLLNPFFETMGAREVPRDEFMKMLQNVWSAPANLW
jgi:leucyl/phenylalanyl-tRNA--protein transferase